MKFSIARDVLLDVLGKVQGLTGRRSNLAITTNVLIRTRDAGINIAATDLETGFEGTYPADVAAEGQVAINARKFFEIVRDFPSDQINLSEVENYWIEIGNEKVEYHLVGLNPEDFPEIPQIADVNWIETEAQALKRMIERALIVGVSDDKRAHILGVYLEKVPEDDRWLLRMVSTDGSRLNKADLLYEGTEAPAIDEAVLIPKKGLHEIARFLEGPGKVQIGLKDNHFVLRRDSETVVIRLLEGDFPPYAEILKGLEGHRIPMDRPSFLMMLKRMSILATDNYRAVVFSFADQRLVIRSTNPDLGESKEDMEIDYPGDAIEVAFNPRFFIETLNAIDEDRVVLTIVNEERPCLLQSAEHINFLSVIMPMRI